MTYLALGYAYATGTPLWESPDEPAHFNYVRHLAQGRGLPVLQPGDYDFAYLEKIKAARFPPQMSIDPIRYEFHQPPLYYILAAPLHRLGAGLPLGQQVLLLRLFSLLLGALTLAVVYSAVGQAFPGQTGLALGTTAFAAFVPQHLHIVSSVNNDILGELALSLVLLLLLRQMRAAVSWPLGIVLGLALGLALLAKTSAYLAIVLAGLAPLFTWAWMGVRPGRAILVRLGVSYAIAAVVSGWWFLRNLMVYGDLDLFGLARHSQVVVGQPRVGVFDWAVAKHFTTVTFQSFWAQFGWMGVPADTRTYVFVGLLSALAGLGLALFLARSLRGGVLSAHQKASLALLGAAALLVLAGMLRYNLEFIQPQGRYLFPTMLPLGLFFVLGLRELMAERYQALLTGLLAFSLFLLSLYQLYWVLIPAFR
jgi:4-amino-4-deoxy-L-arabinose transferase-like glycosyltransferase